MTGTFAALISRKAVAATLVAALSLTTVAVAPARADDKDAIAAAAFFGLIAVGIIAATQAGKARPQSPSVVVRPRALPAVCRFKIRHGLDRGAWYGHRCLVEHHVDVWSLPNRCVQRVDPPGRRQDIVAYSGRCLARAGTVTARPGRDHMRRDRH